MAVNTDTVALELDCLCWRFSGHVKPWTRMSGKGILPCYFLFSSHSSCVCCYCIASSVDAEIEVPSGENTELKQYLFKAWCRSVYSHTCYTYCQGFPLYLFLPFWSIHLHFFQNLFWFFPVLAVANTASCVGPQNKIGDPAGCRFQCWVPAEYEQAKKNMTCGMVTCEMNNLVIEWSLCSALM